MARECPKCKRPNNERAARCMYCGTVFPEPASAPAQPQQQAGQAPAPRPASAPEKKPLPEAFLVTISPSQQLGQAAMNALAVEFQLDPYTAKQKTMSPAPWIARVYPEAQPAQELVAKLIAAGIDAYVVKQSGIDKISDRLQAAGLKAIADSGIIFVDQGGQELPLRFDDVFLVVKGRIKERGERGEDYDEEEASVNIGKMAVNPASSPNDKGAFREAVERFAFKPKARFMRWVMRSQTLEIMDIYRKSSPRAVRVAESEFDYRGLGEDMSPSGLLNYNRLFKAITDSGQDMIIDTTFNTVGYTMNETPKEDRIRTQLDSVLGNSESARRLFDNRAFFDDFSARAYLHYLRENARKKRPA